MKQKIIPIVSVLIGLIAALLTRYYLNNERAKVRLELERLESGYEKIWIVVARDDIPKGTTITRDDLAKAETFKISVRGHAVAMDEVNQILGRKTLFEIKSEEPVFWSDIEGGARGEQGLASIVKPGLRAISLSVGGAAAVSGMVQPNDRVDVLGTFSFPSPTVPEELETVTLTVLQDVTVLATGQQLARDRQGSGGRAGSYATVTLEVTTREAELLVFAQQTRGKLTLSLRNPSDVDFVDDLPTVNFEHLESKLPEYNLYRQRNIRHKSNL